MRLFICLIASVSPSLCMPACLTADDESRCEWIQKCVKLCRVFLPACVEWVNRWSDLTHTFLPSSLRSFIIHSYPLSFVNHCPSHSLCRCLILISLTASATVPLTASVPVSFSSLSQPLYLSHSHPSHSLCTCLILISLTASVPVSFLHSYDRLSVRP